MALIAAGSRAWDWHIDLGEMARIWTGGCIIRARLLDDELGRLLERGVPALRRVCAVAQGAGIPVPALSASLAYYDAYRSAHLPQNLTQAQRDAFGAHTYQRNDVPAPPFVHTDWLG